MTASRKKDPAVRVSSFVQQLQSHMRTHSVHTWASHVNHGLELRWRFKVWCSQSTGVPLSKGGDKLLEHLGTPVLLAA